MANRRLPPGYPHPEPYSQQLVELDRGDQALASKPAGADGLMTVAFEAVSGDRTWYVDRIAVSTTSSTDTQAIVYSGEPSPNRLLGFTSAGNLDYDDANSPYRIAGQQALTIVWTGASLGAIATARIQYRILGFEGGFR
jgi:hypothetical protein